MKLQFSPTLLPFLLVALTAVLHMPGAVAAVAVPDVHPLWPRPREVGASFNFHIRRPLQVVPFEHILPVQKGARTNAAPATGLVETVGPTALLTRQIRALFGPDMVAAGIVRWDVALTVDPHTLPKPEEYTIGPMTGNGILLRAHDVQGLYWAVHTLDALLQGARRVPGGYDVNIPRIHDWPDGTFRAFMIQGAWTRSLDDYKRCLDLLARLHITYFATEFGPQVVLDFDPTMATGARFTKAQAREVIDYGRSLGLKPIGYLNLLGHLDRGYQKAPYTQHGGIDIRSDAAYDRFVYPILSEMLDVYGPVEYFHCGMDEAWELFTWLSKSGEDVPKLLARHIQRIDTYLKARGVKLVIWHDMLIAPELEKQLGGPVGPANGGAPQNTAAALAQIPKDVILDYWYYDPKPAYPALDYLKAQGFTVWASPWETPFSLVRYAAAHKAPTMGTLWDGPPGVFSSPEGSAVAALYAQAAWNADAAPAGVQPEPGLAAEARLATASVLWRRHTLLFPGKTALLLSPAGLKRVPADSATVQFSGVPLDTSSPMTIDPLPDASKALANAADAKRVRIPGGLQLVLDGVNTGREEDQLILYAAPLAKTGTNEYGCEIMVRADGTVQDVARGGSGDHAVPPGGFVLSAHQGPSSAKANALLKLQPGDRVSALDAQGGWIGGNAPTELLVGLPGVPAIHIDSVDTPRESDQLALYNPTVAGGHTGTNEFGVEVVVRNGKVDAVRNGAGNSPIPEDGYVLSAHRGPSGTAARALEGLHPGDSVHLLIAKGGAPQDVETLLAARTVKLPVGAPCGAFYLAMSAGRSTSAETRLGTWIVGYQDGSVERIPVHFGREALAAEDEGLPLRLDDPVWLAQQGLRRFLVREWTNPHPERPVRELTFVPAEAVLETGVRVVGASGAIDNG